MGKYRYFGYVEKVVNFIPDNISSVFDCGSGYGLFGLIMRQYWHIKRVVALDVDTILLKFCRYSGCYTEIFSIDLSNSNLKLPFKDKEFDVVLFTEVIEHLTKNQGYKVLKELERVGKTVIVSTPAIQFPEDSHHISLWTAKDFKKIGFNVHGFGYFMIKGHYIKYISFLLAPIVYRLSDFGSGLIAVKGDIKNV